MGNSGSGLLGGVLSGLGSGLLSNVVGAFSNAQNNATQIKLARENREWQTSERIAQNDWNLDMWNKNNEYNSASSQVQRYYDAGINPYIAMYGGSGTAGSSQQITSASPAGAPNMPQTHPFVPNMDSITNALTSYGIQKANIRKLDTDSDIGQVQLQYLPEYQKQGIKGLTLDNDIKDLDKDYLKDTLQYRKDQQHEILVNQQALNTYQSLKNDEQDFLNKCLPLEKQLGFMQKYADFGLTLARTDLTNVQKFEAINHASLMAAQELTEYAKQSNLRADTGLKYAQTENVNADTTNIKTDTQSKQISNSIALKTMKSFISKVVIENTVSELKLRREGSYQFQVQDRGKSSIGYWLNSTRFAGESLSNLTGLSQIGKLFDK